MKIRWQVEDGYVGKSRPQEANIDDDIEALWEELQKKKAEARDSADEDED